MNQILEVIIKAAFDHYIERHGEHHDPIMCLAGFMRYVEDLIIGHSSSRVTEGNSSSTEVSS